MDGRSADLVKVYYAYGEPVELLWTNSAYAMVEYEDGEQEEIPLDELETHNYMSRVNKDRKVRNYEKHFGSEKRVIEVKSLSCAVCGFYISENAHVKSRGGGGTWEDIVNLCNRHHRELDDQLGKKTFEKKYDIDLDIEAKKLAKRLDKNGNWT